MLIPRAARCASPVAWPYTASRASGRPSRGSSWGLLDSTTGGRSVKSRTCPTNRPDRTTWATGGGESRGGNSALEAPAAVAVGASVRHLLGHLPPLGFEILPPLPRRISRGRPVGVADSRLVRRVRRQLPLGYYRRRALQPPEAGALQPVLPVELLQRPALHLGRIGPGGSERPADLALPCIDMFPIWDTLSVNKTGRCPKWPRPK